MNITIHIGTWIIPVIVTVVCLIICYLVSRKVRDDWGLAFAVSVYITVPTAIVCWVTWLLMTIFK